MNGSEKNDLLLEDRYVVCVGASAGGLEAINEFFDNVSDSDLVAFIVVQHLSSDHKSLLVELLTRHTHMPVVEAIHEQRVEPGNVYVIPNNKELTMRGGLLQLDRKEFDKGPNTAIDTFIQSLAQDQGERAIAVILSGTGTDGTKGIETLKRKGGFVIVQDPASAKFDGMPRSAIASGYTDLVLKPVDMYREITNYIDSVVPQSISRLKFKNEYVRSILNTVYKKTGYDFRQYKQATILRRIDRRMNLVKQVDCEDYDRYIRTHDEEPELLAKEFFIGVTSFFRDKDAFVSLYEEAILNIVKSKEDHEVIRVWVSACSTGQEAYTAAILLDKALKQLNKELEVKIFASDIDKAAIEIASRGRYQQSQLLGLDRGILKEYFSGEGDEMYVLSRIRKQIVFATHDILKDPPFINNDLVLCRNLLIYLNAPLQENVLATLNFALNAGGYLFLGMSENISSISKNFTEVDGKWRIYQRMATPRAFARRTVVSGRYDNMKQPTPAGKTKTNAQLSDDFRNVLVDKLNFAGVYINENYDIKEGIGAFKKYLSLPDKLDTFNLLKMASPELTGILSKALRQCVSDNKAETIKNIRIKAGDVFRLINIYIYPPRETASAVYYLVVFSDTIIDDEKMPLSVHDMSKLQKDQYVQQLEDELRETRINLQMAIENLETTNEELQSSNEELQSANEELQSSNEELQSLNEELHTLNTEHQMRIHELVELNDDITNYLQTSLIGQIFLDHELKIRRFNSAASSVINIIETDIGRPIDHITHYIKGNKFFQDLQKANENGQVIEREYELYNGKVYLIRILPYMRQDKVQDGLVITLVDISVTTNLNTLIKSVFDASTNPIFVFETTYDDRGEIADFLCTIANHTAYTSFGKHVREDKLSLRKDFAELATANAVKKYKEVVQTGQAETIEIQFTKNRERFWYQAKINKMQDGFVLVLADITQQKEAEEKLRKNYNELIVAKDALRELNNQLEVKVKERTNDLKISEERFRTIASLTNDVIWDWNFLENELWLSDSYYDLFGYAPTNPQVNTHAFRLENIHPDDRAVVEETFNAVLHDPSKEFNLAYRYKKKSGEYAYILDRGTLLVDQGVPYRMIGAMVDVTKLERSKQQLERTNAELESLIQQFRFVADFMPQMVWATQPDGTHDFFNKQWYDYTGTIPERTEDSRWLAMVHPKEYDKAAQSWDEALASGKPYYMECRLQNKNQGYRWFLVRASPMWASSHTVTRWFGTCTDIQDQKMAERVLEEKVFQRTRELKMLNERLRTSNADLMQFASVASHDLKEPLRKIQFFSGLILEKHEDQMTGDLGDYMERITRASSRATSLINDVLSYSRLSSEKFIEKVDLNKILRGVLQDLELIRNEKQAIINIEELPQIDAVPSQMRQLFQNIISNSLKFHKPGQPPVINITVHEVSKNEFSEFENSGLDDYCEIRVKDQGIGFEEKYVGKIFSLFGRLNSKDEYEGTGIGLSIVKKIVEGHHGIIRAKGKEDEGAEFIIVLPLHQMPEYEIGE